MTDDVDIPRLRLLARSSGRHELSASERSELVQRVLARWPDQPSVVLRLAAVAHGIDAGLDERLARAPAQLSECAGRDPWTIDSDEAKSVLLAALVRAEAVEYESGSPHRDTPMPLRDALTDSEDSSTIAAMVRWEALMRLAVVTPDRLLASWRTHAASIASDAGRWDPDEYGNTLDIRSHLQMFSAALSWAGQAQWREHIEPADDVFRTCTERRHVPLALTLDARPGGWWRYRVPVGASPAFRERMLRDVEPGRYLAGPTGLGRYGSLRTINDVFEFAERPHGLRAMTDQELAYWARVCTHQSDHEGGSQTQPTFWRERADRANEERRRRAASAGP